MRYLLAFLLSLPAWAAITATVPSDGVTQMQAIMKITGASTACTIEVSPSVTYTPLARDFDPAYHASSNVDTSRPDTITQSNGDRYITVGHAFQDRALAPVTTYYYRVSGCGTATGTFATTNVPVGATQQFPIPVDRTAWANRGNNISLADLKAGNPINDAVTGVTLRQATNLTDASWTWPREIYHGWPATTAFPYFDKGIEWANPQTAGSGASSRASTSTSNPLDLYIGRFDEDWANGGWFTRTIFDAAISAFGSGTTAHVCIFLEPSDPCIPSGFDINMTGGSGMAQVNSTNPRLGRTWPAAYPSPIFSGWGMASVPTADNRLKIGTLAVTSGDVILDSVNATSYFPSSTKQGHKIWITGSHLLTPPCVNDLCTIDHIVDAQHAVLSEAITTATGTYFVLMGFGIRITNTQPGTAMSFGATWEVAGSIPNGLVSTAGGLQCAGGAGFTSGHTPPKTLKWCIAGGGGNKIAYLIGDDGWTKRLATLEGIPPNSYFTDQLGWSINDAPCKQPACVIPGQSEGWIYWGGIFPLNARTYFLSGPANNGQSAFWKITYMGDGTEDRDVNYTMSMAGANGGFGVKYQLEGAGSTATWDKFKWELLLTGSQSLAAQIPVRFPSYNAAFYGLGFSFTGVSDHTAFFANSYSGLAQDGPCVLAVVDLNNGVLKNLMNLGTGEGVPNDSNGIFNGGIFGGCHNTTVQPKLPNSAGTSLHAMAASSTQLKLGGPFVVTPQAIKRGGVWDPSICMTWPWNDTTWCQGVAVPDTDCSVLAAGSSYLNIHGRPAMRDHDCLAVRVPHGGLCNTSPKSVEQLFPTFVRPGGGDPGYAPNRVQAGSTAFNGTGSHTWTIEIDGNDLGAGNFRGSFKWKKDSGSWTTNVAITGAGDIMLSDNQSILWPWGGVAEAIIGDHWTLSTSAIQEKDLGVCPWNPNYSRPVPTRLGTTLMELSDSGAFDEVMRIIKIDEGTNGGLSDDWVIQRNAVSDYNCVAPGPFEGSTCVMGAIQAQHPRRGGSTSPDYGYCATHVGTPQACHFYDSWLLAGAPDGMQGGWGTNVFWNSTPSGMVPQSLGGVAAGHGTATDLGGGLYTFATAAGAMTPKPLDEMFAVPPGLTSIAFGGPVFHGAGPNIGGGSTQAYFDLVAGRPTGMDYNSMADNGGGNSLGLRDMIATTTPGIWKIELIGDASADPKLFFPHGWAGQYLLEDVSSPELPASGPSTSLSATYAYCIPLHDGQCYAGSTEADRGSHGNRIAYANVPAAYSHPYGRCMGFYMWGNVPCIVMGWPGQGAVREQGVNRNSAGNNSRILSYVNSIPGETRSYSEMVPTFVNSAWVTPNMAQGIYPVGWFVNIPPWYESPVTTANDIIQIPVTVPAGNAYADIEFGYSRFGTPSQFRCHSRPEGCSTSGTPYAFASEAKTYRSDCASGCTIDIPTMAGNIAYYRVNRSTNGTTWTNGEIQPLAISGVVSAGPNPCSDLTYIPTSTPVLAAGDSGTVQVSVPDQSCVSTHTSNQGWMSLLAGNCSLASGTVTCAGNGTFGWNAASNAGASRVAVISSSSGVTDTATQFAGTVTAVPRISGARISGARIQ